MLRLATEVVLALLIVCGIAFCLLALWIAQLFKRESPQQFSVATLPPVSVLKPLHGADVETYAALRSHCIQDYESYQLIFGVNDANDDAVPVVRELAAEFPTRDIQLVVCPDALGSNRKVSNLIHLLRQAKYQHILVNDADIRVGRRYLREVMWLFKDSEIGMVTCLYKGKPAGTIGSKLESLGIATDFIPGVLISSFMEGGLRFALGSTMAMVRTALEKIGGFESVVDYLADDYQLGARVADAGFKVSLAHETVETAIPPYSFAEFWQHQLRWARTMRVSRPRGYGGLVLTFALPWAVLLVACAPHSLWSWALLAMALLARVGVALRIGLAVLGAHQIARDLWLLPLRDLLGTAIWFWSYAGDTVSWRGTKFRLKDGRICPVSNDDTKGFACPNPEARPETHRR